MTDGDAGDRLRIDRWLWYARFYKSRSRATQLCSAGRVRVNRQVVRKAHQVLRVGDVLTFPQGPHIRVVEVKALGRRRGPAPEARSLYQDLAPPYPGNAAASAKIEPAHRERGAGRPTKRDRRHIDRLHGDG